jgi:hypothetical protein
MAWTNLLNAVFAIDKAITSATGLALRDNVAALAENAAGSPPMDGMMRLLSETVITGTPSAIDFFFDDTLYDAVQFKLSNVRLSSDGTFLASRVSDDGTTFESGASSYSYQAVNFSGTLTIDADATRSLGLLCGIGIGNATGEDGVTGYLNVYNPSLAQRTVLEGAVFYYTTAGARVSTLFNSSRNSSIAAKGVQFSPFSGTFVSGTITMYGVRK